MLGKSGTIQTIELSTSDIDAWLKSWPDLDIISIQYQVVYEQDYGCHSSALIIYKEEAA